MQKNNYEVQILVNGKKIPEYLHDGKVYIEGKKSTRYSIKVKNNSWKRIKAVISVDGLSVISGKLADFNSSGYIVNSQSSLTIDGWRKNNEEVAEFYFSDMEDSYSTKIEKGGNQGVIGVAIFEEEKKYIYTYGYTGVSGYTGPSGSYGSTGGTSITNLGGLQTSSFTTSSCSGASLDSSQTNVYVNMSRAPKQDLGTGWGKTKRSECINTSFDTDRSSLSMFQIFYSSRKQLEKAGIRFNKVNYISSPNPFPNEFCEEPRR